MTYQTLVPDGRRRPFVITLGTVPGYATDGQALPAQRAIDAATGWMLGRAAAQQPYLTGNFVHGTLAYAWVKPGAGAVAMIEPSLAFAGDVSVLYHSTLLDQTVVNILNELADVMGTVLAQTRVYLSYRDMAWVREDDGAASRPPSAAPASEEKVGGYRGGAPASTVGPPAPLPSGSLQTATTGCRCHAHGVGHAPVDPSIGYSVANGWTSVPLCTGCAHGGCYANRPLPPALRPDLLDNIAEALLSVPIGEHTSYALVRALNAASGSDPGGFRAFLREQGISADLPYDMVQRALVERAWTRMGQTSSTLQEPTVAPPGPSGVSPSADGSR
jgi:hypothetical protein